MTLFGAFAFVALVPAMVGPGGEAGPATVTFGLCAGGSIIIPLDDRQGPAQPPSPACARGCHGASQRKRNGPTS